jgi:hypothetical protein
MTRTSGRISWSSERYLLHLIPGHTNQRSDGMLFGRGSLAGGTDGLDNQEYAVLSTVSRLGAHMNELDGSFLDLSYPPNRSQVSETRRSS